MPFCNLKVGKSLDELVDTHHITVDGSNQVTRFYVNYPPPKGCELLVFASTEPLVLTQ